MAKPGTTPRNKATIHDQTLTRGNGGEVHQVSDGNEDVLTTAQGGPVADDLNTLSQRGPALIEDFSFSRKTDVPPEMSTRPCVALWRSERHLAASSSATAAVPVQKRHCPNRSRCFIAARIVKNAWEQPRFFAVRVFEHEGTVGCRENSMPKRRRR